MSKWYAWFSLSVLTKCHFYALNNENHGLDSRYAGNFNFLPKMIPLRNFMRKLKQIIGEKWVKKVTVFFLYFVPTCNMLKKKYLDNLYDTHKLERNFICIYNLFIWLGHWFHGFRGKSNSIQEYIVCIYICVIGQKIIIKTAFIECTMGLSFY